MHLFHTCLHIKNSLYGSVLNLLYIQTIASIAYPRSDMVIELQDEDEMYVKQWSEGFEGVGCSGEGSCPTTTEVE